MSDKYNHAFADVRRDKKIGVMCKAAGVSPSTFHDAMYRRGSVGEKSAQKIYGVLRDHGYLSRCATFVEMFPRHESKENTLVEKITKSVVYEHSLAALWLEWKSSPLIIRGLYETGCKNIREQAKIYLENMPLAPRGTADTIDMRNLSREWVKKQEVRT